MPRVSLDVSTDDLRDLILQLPANELLALAAAIQERAETLGLMKIAASHQSVLHRRIGTLPSDLMARMQRSLKLALQIP